MIRIILSFCTGFNQLDWKNSKCDDQRRFIKPIKWFTRVTGDQGNKPELEEQTVKGTKRLGVKRD